jgi:uncharacterized phage protein (TIGR02220 family)
MAGWISLHRSIKSHWIWNDPIKFQWWVDILLSVNHSDTKVNIGFRLIECKRGQSVRSLQSWANQWNCSKDTARNFTRLLQKDHMIVLENLQNSTRLTVCNYDLYQKDLHVEPTVNKRKPNATPTQTIINNNDNHENNELVLFPPLENKFEFDDFIKLFNTLTNRQFQGDKKTQAQFKARIKAGYTKDKFKKAIENVFNNKWFAENPTYLTPEYITRSDKLEQYLNAKPQVGAGVSNNLKTGNNGSNKTNPGDYAYSPAV